MTDLVEQFSAPRRRTAPAFRPALAGPAVALVTFVIATIACIAVGVPLRDPGGVSLMRCVSAAGVLALAIGLDLLWVTVRGGGFARARARWPRARIAGALVALAAFYGTYFAYRNLKSLVPVVRPGTLFDEPLTDLDHALFFGHAPAQVLHDVLGTGLAAHGLAAVYLGFFGFIPIVLALALVWAPSRRAGTFLVVALALNWLFAALGYYLLPSLGPFHAEPHVFASLPHTGVTDMQDKLVSDRASFLADPAAAGRTQSIGAFPSLHVAIFATVALGARALRLPRPVQAVAWVMVVLTVLATLYFGWHYLPDDVAGFAIAAAALAVSAWMTGYRPVAAGRSEFDQADHEPA